MIYQRLLVITEMSSKSAGQKNCCHIFVYFLLTLDAFSSANECLGNTLYEHPTDCSKFYSCASYGPVLMQCPAGLHFNPHLLVCDWPGRAGCKSSNEGYNCPIFSDPSDCSKFYFCSLNGHISMACPAGLHFNSQFLVCDWPENVRCPVTPTHRPQITTFTESNGDVTTEFVTIDPNIETTTNNAPETDITETGIFTVYTTTSNTEEFTTNTDNTTPSIQTTTNYVQDTAKTEPDISTIYTTATNTESYTTSNTEGITITTTDLNTEKYATDLGTTNVHESTYNVEETTTSPNSVTNAIYTTTFNNEESTTNVELGSTIETPTTKDTYSTTLIDTNNESHTAHTTDEGTSTIFYSTLSNTEQFVTDSMIFPEGFSETPSTQMPTEHAILENKCPIYADPDDCTKFYSCSPNGPIRMDCPKGLQFNSQFLVCDWSKNRSCGNLAEITTQYSTTGVTDDVYNTETTTSTSEQTTEDVSTTEIELSSSPTSETTLDDFIRSTISIQPDSTTTSYYNDSTDAETVFVNNSDVCNSTIWPHPTDCGKFIMASPTGTIELICPRDLLFNQKLLVCDVAANVACPENSLTTTEILTSTDLESSDSTGYFLTHIESAHTTEESVIGLANTATGPSVRETTTNVESKELTTSEENNNDTSTSGQTTLDSLGTTDELFISDIASTTVMNDYSTIAESTESTDLCESSIWPHPTDCSKFFMCDSTGSVEMLCPDDLLFNPALLICDWPQNFNCSESLTTTLSAETTFVTDYTTPTQYDSTQFDENHVEVTTHTYGETKLRHNVDHSQLCQGSIWPHPSDCAKFFKCGASGPIEMICPDKLRFNPALLACDWPKNFACQHTSSTASSSIEDQSIRKSSRIKHYNKFKLADTNESCAKRKESYFLIPDPDDCRSFLICDHGSTYRSSCPEQFLFNKVLTACVAFTNSGSVECVT